MHDAGSFSGFPAGVSTGGTLAVVDPYGPVSFTFTAASSVPRGTYTGTLAGPIWLYWDPTQTKTWEPAQ